MPILPPEAMPIGAYHDAAPNWLSKTSINYYRRHGPKAFWLRYIDRSITEPRPDGSVQGLALDCLLTEGEEALALRFPTVPDDSPKRPTKAQRNAKKPAPATIEAIKWWDEFEATFPNAEIISPDDHVILHELADSIRMLPIWKEIERARAQQTVRRMSDSLGLGLQSRPDWLFAENGWYYDLKKSRDISRFGAQAIDLGYHLQAAVSGWCLAGDGIALERSYLIAGEWARGGRARAYLIPEEALKAGYRDMCEAAAEISRRINEKDWLDVQAEPEPLPIPDWIKRKMEAM